MNKRILLTISLLSVCSLSNAHAGIGSFFGFGTSKSAEYQLAEDNLKNAQKSVAEIDARGEKSGFHAAYNLNNPLNENSFYTQLAANPALVSLYASMCKDVYAAVKLEHGKHLNVDQVTKAIGPHNLAAIGYHVEWTFERWGSQFSGALLFNPSENKILIVFAGTKTTTDGLMDLDFLRHPGGDATGVVPANYNVHKGVAQAVIDGFAYFKPKFDHLVDQALNRGDVEVITMGHSLGGAISVLAADYIYRNLIAKHNLERAFIGKLHQVNVRNITFGAPRVFSKQTAVEVDERLGKSNILRFWNKNDPVPAVVAGFLTNSKHVGLDFRIDDSGIPSIDKHRMPRYVLTSKDTFIKYVSESKVGQAVRAQYDMAKEAMARVK